MQKKLPDHDAVPGKVAFEAANILEALLPDSLRNKRRWNFLLCQKLRMHANHQRFLVIAPIENANVPAVRQAFHTAEEKIVVEVLRSRRLEGKDLAALGVDAGHDVLDGAILAGCVHGLKNQQHSPFVLRVQLVLQLREGLDTKSQRLFRAGFGLGLQSQGVIWVHILQPKLCAVSNAKRLCKLVSSLQQLFHVHRKVLIPSVGSALLSRPSTLPRSRGGLQRLS